MISEGFMVLKDKVKFAKSTLILYFLGFMVGANLYSLYDFKKGINKIEENSRLIWLIGTGKTYSESYIHQNRKFPNNVLTLLSRQDAKRYIRKAEKIPIPLD